MPSQDERVCFMSPMFFVLKYSIYGLVGTGIVMEQVNALLSIRCTDFKYDIQQKVDHIPISIQFFDIPRVYQPHVPFYKKRRIDHPFSSDLVDFGSSSNTKTVDWFLVSSS